MARRPKPWFRKSRKSWFVQLNGRQVNLGPDKKEAFERFYKLMRQPESSTVASDSLAAIIDAFLEWTTNNRSPDTYEWYRYRLQRFVERYPDMCVADLKPFHVETWAVSYELSVTSRRNYLRTVKRCLKWAHKQGYIDHNPIEHLEVPRGESKEVCIEADDYARLLSYVRNSSLRDLIETTWETGCRPQESLRVEARHVDLNQRRWVFSQSESKGKRNSRVVYLSDKALEIVARLTRQSSEGRIFRNLNGKPWNPMAVNCAFGALRVRMGKDEMKRRGEAIDEKTVSAFIKTLNPEKVSKGRAIAKTETELRAEARRKLTDKRARELAPRYSLYALRHSWATHALRKGIDPLTVAILMGHKDPSTLARVYQHLSLSPQHMLEQAQRAAG